MPPAKFRALATELPEVVEGSHMNHPDFRVGGKVFASLTPDEREGCVRLTPVQQREFLQAADDVFYLAAGAWGKRGYTLIRLTKAKVGVVREALRTAWQNTAPAKPGENR